MLSATAARHLTTILAAWLLAAPAAAHGAFIDAASVEAVAIHARYDTGEPMAEAQVFVFAPDNPAQPWLTGQTDADGQFIFTPNDTQGRWAVQVRQAGHGAMGYVEVGADGGATILISGAAGSALTGAQRALMVVCVLWGCIGTALYFRPPRGARQA